MTKIKALTFDVFGTVVDWRTGVAREAEAVLGPKGHALDWGAFADGWRARYVPALFSDTWPSASYTDRVEGLLGLGLLSHFRVIVDWPHDRLFLIPAAKDVTD